MDESYVQVCSLYTEGREYGCTLPKDTIRIFSTFAMRKVFRSYIGGGVVI